MIGVEIFSGVGGMSTGAAMAGIEIVKAVEIDKYTAETFRFNHSNADVSTTDIKQIKKIELSKKRNEQTILMGGPPCQGFSKSNVNGRNIDNPKNWLFKEYLRVTKLMQPDWFVLENVQGLLETENGLFLEEILKGFKKLGYNTNYKVLNAKNYGVPQSRERLFIIGNLHNEKIIFPTETHIEKFVTVGDALKDLPNLENGNIDIELSYKRIKPSNYALQLRNENKKIRNNGVSRNRENVIERYAYIEQGGNWKNVPKNLMDTYTDVSRCHSGIYHRLHEDKPSVVIGNYRKNMLIHPWQNRGLSVREAARLQSFPDNFTFKGSLNSQQQQVGNAVPPLLAKAVFEKIV